MQKAIGPSGRRVDSYERPRHLLCTMRQCRLGGTEVTVGCDAGLTQDLASSAGETAPDQSR
jgi:hypothetical protein